VSDLIAHQIGAFSIIGEADIGGRMKPLKTIRPNPIITSLTKLGNLSIIKAFSGLLEAF